MKRHTTLFFLFFCSTFFYAPHHTSASKPQKDTSIQQITPASSVASETQKYDSIWNNLYTRLLKDGFSEKQLEPYFIQLNNSFSQKPMGNKVKELYNANFVPKKKSTAKKEKNKKNSLGIPYPWYDGYVTKKNAQKCQAFIKEHEKYFIMAEKKYAIPKEVLSALIYVETWHGKFMGKFTPLPMLASMAISTDLTMLPAYTKNISFTPKQKKWMTEKIQARADWAYKELKALLRYSLKNDININSVPSSIYGALGYGQFMPSNIFRFGVDGNKDGKIDLYNPEDAIISIANFLNKQGWTQKNPSFAKQVKVLKRYNYSTAYAHTILALAKLSKNISTPQKG